MTESDSPATSPEPPEGTSNGEQDKQESLLERIKRDLVVSFGAAVGALLLAALGGGVVGAWVTGSKDEALEAIRNERGNAIREIQRASDRGLITFNADLSDSVDGLWRTIEERTVDHLNSISIRVDAAFNENIGGVQDSVRVYLNQIDTVSIDANNLLVEMQLDRGQARTLLGELELDREVVDSLLHQLRTERDEAGSLVEEIELWTEADSILDELAERLQAWARTAEILALLHENHPDVDFEEGSASFRSPQGPRVAYIGKATDSIGGGYARFYDKNEDAVAYIGVEGDGTGGLISLNGRLERDVAEVFEIIEDVDVPPGTVVSILPSAVKLAPSNGAYDRRVIGVVSGAGGLRPGIAIGGDPNGPAARAVAIAGQVYVRVNLEGGHVQPGDLIVPSSAPGVAMRATDRTRVAGELSSGKRWSLFRASRTPLKVWC